MKMRLDFRWFLPAALFAVASLVDLSLQRESRTQLEEFFANPCLEVCGILLTSVKLGLAWGACPFLLGKWAKWILAPLWVWVVLVETAEVFARIYYRMSLDGDWLMIVLASSMDEMRELASGFGGTACLLGVCAFVVAAVGGIGLIVKTPVPRVTWRSVLVGVACLSPFVAWNLILHPPATAFNEAMYTFLPVDTVHNWGVYSDIGRMAKAPRLPGTLRIVAKPEQRPRGVYVIGESATRAHWHLYGYGRPTTPELDALRDELVVFEKVVATHATTGKALRMLLTEATLEKPETANCTLGQQLSAAGYACALFSAQARWGRWEGVETLLFSGCDRKVYLDEQPREGARDEGPFDDELIPLLEDAWSGTNSPEMVFLHLDGSHAPQFYRYPQKRSVYPRYEGDVPPGMEKADAAACNRVDCYDNSIAFTDHVLAQVVEQLGRRAEPSFLLYLSDHGETPNAPAWRDASDASLWQVPFVVWFSPKYREAHPDIVSWCRAESKKELRLDQALPILRRLACVRVEEALSK